MAHGSATSFFPGASGVQMRDIQYFEASHVTVHTGGNVGDRSIDGWELLLRNIAPNALHDSRARYDAPKCDEDTRVEVIGEIMDWAQDRNAPQRLLCMTGAAGAGKSALQQTIAEHCIKSDILSAAVFFSSADPTRNTISFVVPTIAYQMGLQNNTFRSSVAAAVKHDRHIFCRSLQSQIDALIVRPFKSLQRNKQIDISTFPFVIVIDGLDECNGEPNTTSSTTQVIVDDRRRAEDQQAELLAAIKHCILDNDLLFRVLISSRPEWAIRSALEPGGHLREVAYHIQLSHQYDASGDMHRYLQRRFEDIGLRMSYSKWFRKGDIETLVRAASGQFIYVATVYKYIIERGASPAERLNVVLTWTPHAGQVARPFEALDRVYSNILLAAKNTYEAVDTHHGRDFLLLFRGYEINVAGFMFSSFPFPFRFPIDILSVLLGLKARAAENILSDLHSLMDFEKGPLCLRLHHNSFSDFLKEELRAKDLFVPESRVVVHLAKCMMQHIIECPVDFDSLPAEWGELPLRLLYRCSLMEAVENLPFFLSSATAIDEEIVGFTHNGGWRKIDNLLPLLYRLRSFFYEQFEKWRGCMGQLTRDLRLRKPDVAAVISQFVDKWERDVDQWESEMDSDSDSGDSDTTSDSSDLDLDSDSSDLDSMP